MASRMKDRKVRVLCALCFQRTNLFCSEALLKMELFHLIFYFFVILTHIIADRAKY